MTKEAANHNAAVKKVEAVARQLETAHLWVTRGRGVFAGEPFHASLDDSTRAERRVRIRTQTGSKLSFRLDQLVPAYEKVVEWEAENPGKRPPVILFCPYPQRWQSYSEALYFGRTRKEAATPHATEPKPISAKPAPPTTPLSMMTENQVVEAVARHLETMGYEILEKRSTKERGTDLVAQRNGIRLLVEAKGGGSAMATSKRFGQPFHDLQKRHHVAEAVFQGMMLREQNQADDVALAFPDDATHRRWIQRVHATLAKTRVSIFFVAADGSVTREP